MSLGPKAPKQQQLPNPQQAAETTEAASRVARKDIRRKKNPFQSGLNSGQAGNTGGFGGNTILS